ncbi:CpaF family protein [archaeon]|jgi:archaeal flagellar protein FlaI|nr:CpaF family protein [Candidatus Woesearchaeota archaeon]MBT4166064.1 CpaF family protein [archaeon]
MKKKKETKPNLKKEKLDRASENQESKKTNNKTPLGIVETYEIEVDRAIVKVHIEKQTYGHLYQLNVPQINIATASLLDEVRTNLVSATTIGMKEIIDPNAFKKIKTIFMKDAEDLLKEKLPTLDLGMMKFLVGKLMQDMLGLGEIEFLVNDPNLEEIVLPSSKEPIRVYHKKYGWLKTNITIEKEEDIINYSNIIARRVGRQINVLAPLLDAHLISGDRVNSILYPISTKGNTITIRKFARDPFTIIDLINNKTISLDMAVLVWLAIEYEMNILISGGTASGKTVLLNACMPFIPPNHRIISVEDTRELTLPEFLYWCPLVTRSPNPEGKGEVSMLDLLVNSLRMRPDRIVLGEMRREEEARVMFEAMHTGHSVYATLHANSSAETISRLTNPPLNVPQNLLNAVNLNIVVFRDRRKGVRRILHISEFEFTGEKITPNILYRWIPEGDQMIKHSESSRFFEDISRNTGMSNNEIEKNLKEKKDVLLWLIKNKIRALESFGKTMNLYYSNKEELLKDVSNNNIKRILKTEEDSKEQKISTHPKQN